MPPLRSTNTAAPTAEEQLPSLIPRPINPDGIKLATVKLKVDYWPSVPVENSSVERPGRLLAGSRVALPYDEARHIVGRGIAELAFE
jgi:hypothetical protein